MFLMSTSSQIRNPFVAHVTAVLNVYYEKGGAFGRNHRQERKEVLTFSFTPP